MGALVEHEDALRASLLAVYGVRLSRHDYGVLELADLVAHLPPGCALWRASGGPLAWTDDMHLLARAEYTLRVLAWMKTEDGQNGRNRPRLQEPPKVGALLDQEQEVQSARAAAWQARQARHAAD